MVAKAAMRGQGKQSKIEKPTLESKEEDGKRKNKNGEGRSRAGEQKAPMGPETSVSSCSSEEASMLLEAQMPLKAFWKK